MKTDRIEEKLRGSTQRKEERLALWRKIKTKLEGGDFSDVKELLGEMTTSLEKRRSQVSAKLAEDMGVKDDENQEP